MSEMMISPLASHRTSPTGENAVESPVSEPVSTTCGVAARVHSSSVSGSAEMRAICTPAESVTVIDTGTVRWSSQLGSRHASASDHIHCPDVFRDLVTIMQSTRLCPRIRKLPNANQVANLTPEK